MCFKKFLKFSDVRGLFNFLLKLIPNSKAIYTKYSSCKGWFLHKWNYEFIIIIAPKGFCRAE